MMRVNRFIEFLKLALRRKFFQEAAICLKHERAASPNFTLCGTCDELPDTSSLSQVLIQQYLLRWSLAEVPWFSQ